MVVEKSSERLICYDGELRRKREKQMTPKQKSGTRKKEGKMEITRDLRLRRNKDAIKELGREIRR